MKTIEIQEPYNVCTLKGPSTTTAIVAERVVSWKQLIEPLVEGVIQIWVDGKQTPHYAYETPESFGERLRAILDESRASNELGPRRFRPLVTPRASERGY